MFCFQSSTHLKIKVKSWLRDTHGLYDYESKEITKQKYQVSQHSRILWSKKTAQAKIELQMDGTSTKANSFEEKQFLVGYVEPEYTSNKVKSFTFHSFDSRMIEKKSNSSDSTSISKKKAPCAYIVVRDYSKANGYPLKTGTIIRLGIIEFRVIEINSQNKGQKSRSASQQRSCFLDSMGNEERIVELAGSQEGSCKICLSEQQSAEDPLISPCKCTGSCSTVHLNCLKNWINTKVKREAKGVVSSLNFNKFECQICKEPYPTTINYKGKCYIMVTLEQPSQPYIVLEAMNHKQSNPNEKSIHVITMSEGKNIKVGRGDQCEIMVEDKTISRVHSHIQLLKGNYYIQDNNSRFGTLVRLDESMTIKNKLTLQMGRSIFQMSLN